jgi:hypothetical protein
MNPFIHGLLAGFFIGVGICGAFVLHRFQRRPKMPTMRRRKLYGELKEGVDALRSEREVREVDFWDVGEAAERGVRYEFLNQTGMEQE